MKRVWLLIFASNQSDVIRGEVIIECDKCNKSEISFLEKFHYSIDRLDKSTEFPYFRSWIKPPKNLMDYYLD